MKTMETTTETGKNQKLSRKLREEYVEAIQIISSSLKTLCMIRRNLSLQKWGSSAVG